MSEPALGRPDSWDVLHTASVPASQHFSTVNVGETVPGVQTPLSLYTWRRTVSTGINVAGRTIGVFTEADGFEGDIILPFYGRAAIAVDFLKLFAERMPGADPVQAIEAFLGHVPKGMSFEPTRRFYLNVLRRYPAAFMRLPGRVVATTERIDAWWLRFVVRVDTADPADEAVARALLADALERQFEGAVMQTVSAFAAVQPVHDALVKTVEQAGAGDVSALTAPIGGAEAAVIHDLWEASRGRGSVASVVERHGFHGPREGELSSRVWRENDRPVRRLIEQYTELDEDESPARRAERTLAARDEAAADLLSATPSLQRPAVRALLALGARRLPLRGVGKRAMIQGFDGARSASRHLGRVLAERGDLDDAEDIFYLTLDELTGPMPADARELVALRRERREAYEGLALPVDWSGNPEPIVLSSTEASDRTTRVIQGVGVSGGVVEGTARVVDDPSFAEIESEEILVAPTTDPSWASIMFVSTALVVDIGGAFSHAAVVARELGLPCVVNTGVGTTAIRTGDRLRVDGDRGTVEIVVPV